MVDSPIEETSAHQGELLRASPVVRGWVSDVHTMLVHCPAGMCRSASVIMGDHGLANDAEVKAFPSESTG